MKDWLTTEIQNCLDANNSLPLQDILADSLFYPAAGVDGSPVRHAKLLGVNSFVYVDTITSEGKLDETFILEPFRGYQIFGQRGLVKEDLIPNGWAPRLPESFDQGLMEQYNFTMRLTNANPLTAFATWFILKRDQELDDTHGPESFSFLYIRGEGVATYQALYIEQKILPSIVAIIRPGTGFGGNYGDFEELFFNVAAMHSEGMPPRLLEWHSRKHPNRNVDSPWVKHYPTRLLEPLPKDDEPGFALSLYGTQKLTNPDDVNYQRL